MTESEQSLNESLSAAVDSEAKELELRRVLQAVDADAELRAKWQRMHLIGSVLRNEAIPAVLAPVPAWTADDQQGESRESPPDGRTDEAAEVQESSRSPRRWVAPVGGAALAAAAALVVVLYFGNAPEDAPGPAVAERPDALAHGLDSVPTELDLQRANAYIYQHHQHARGASIIGGINARPAAMPLVQGPATAPARLQDADGATSAAGTGP